MTNTVIIKPHGPLIAQGKIRIIDSSGQTILESTEAFLCRCGASNNKPFCDGSHKGVNFVDDGQFADEKAEPMPNTTSDETELEITCRDKAMLIAKGSMIIRSADGLSTTFRNKAAFCRCGASKNKPFCDISHKIVNTQ